MKQKLQKKAPTKLEQAQIMVTMWVFVVLCGFAALSTASKLGADSIVTNKGTVLVLYTGGTIGMKQTIDGLRIQIGYRPHRLEEELLHTSAFHDVSYSFSEKEKELNSTHPLIALPLYKQLRTLYHVLQYESLLDSSNMNMTHWLRIASDIKKHYREFDGFVVLHGTDTMAYTSSALSFMLENLGKPVVITGSQVPISEVMSDGSANFIGALVIAAHCHINEVMLYFNNKLFRGNRVTKKNAEGFDAFESPNYFPLATVGTHVKYVKAVLHNEPMWGPFGVTSNMSTEVGILWLYPGITTTIVESFLNVKLKGVVLKAFGSGNVPEYLIDKLREACDRGIIIVSSSQCAHGHVTNKYMGKQLEEAGVIPGADMTTEAVFTKLSYLLSREDLNRKELEEMLKKPLRGELSENLEYDAGDSSRINFSFNARV